MILQQKNTLTFREYELDIGQGPLSIFIPYDQHLEFEHLIAGIDTPSIKLLETMVNMFNGSII